MLKYYQLRTKKDWRIRNKEGMNVRLVKVRDVMIGEGLPKVCVPIAGRTKEEIISQAILIERKEPDIVEWRSDWFDDISDYNKINEVILELRNILKEIPLLFTFRTLNEGGEKEISGTKYEELLSYIIQNQLTDMIDIEAFFDKHIVKKIVSMTRSYAIISVLSNHDFDKTPEKAEMIQKMRDMQDMESDIIKLAVMPKDYQDMLQLLAATEEMVRMYANIPVITMSMSRFGVMSRVTGELFGSAVTFANAGVSTAPGQVDIDTMKHSLAMIHALME